jgi:pimeloyl-ACP methyl ester carboxylesterase
LKIFSLKKKQKLNKTSAFLFILSFSWLSLHAQSLQFQGKEFEIVNTNASVVRINGKKALKIERDLDKLAFDANRLEATVDEPTFARLKGLELQNGIVEFKMLSRIQNPSPFARAQGFIGLAFRIAAGNEAFEAVYLRPRLGRSDNQLSRNHTIQYLSYPDYKFEKLRRPEHKGQYESQADVSLDEWITMRYEIKGNSVQLYVNDQKNATFVVREMLGQSRTGGIGLWVDIGTEGYFRDLKITKWPDSPADSTPAAAKPVNTSVDRFFTTSDGVRLHYRVSGSGTPLVIFPGYGQDITKFNAIYPELEKYFTVYNLDYRWLGQSESPVYGYHIERFATDAKEMIEDAGIDKFYLFAHSMGNAVSWCYFSVFGQGKVLKYILGDEAPCLITDPVWTQEEAETYTGSANRKDMFTAWRPPGKLENRTIPQEMMSNLLNDHIGRDWRDVLPAIKVPTLIIMGGKSHFHSPLLYQYLNSTIKGSRLEIIREGGHGYYETHPAEFNKIVIDFLKE